MMRGMIVQMFLVVVGFISIAMDEPVTMASILFMGSLIIFALNYEERK